jgi:hypothetical protein
VIVIYGKSRGISTLGKFVMSMLIFDCPQDTLASNTISVLECLAELVESTGSIGECCKLYLDVLIYWNSEVTVGSIGVLDGLSSTWIMLKGKDVGKTRIPRFVSVIFGRLKIDFVSIRCVNLVVVMLVSILKCESNSTEYFRMHTPYIFKVFNKNSLFRWLKLWQIANTIILLLFLLSVKAEHTLTLFKEKLSIFILLLDPNIWGISAGIATKPGPDTIFVLAFF